MVPADQILKKAIEEDVDIIGLSGLITPSLDEMVHVASEMERLGIHKPLLIGGATTSKAHTSVKIDPCFHKDIVAYVPDASKAVGVTAQLLNPEKKPLLAASLTEEYEKIRIRNSNRSAKSDALSYLASVANKAALNWKGYEPPVPTFTGTKTITGFPLKDLLPFVDWTPFFIAWELAGKYPKILEDDVVGEPARQLFDDAQKLLNEIIEGDLLQANAIIGFWPANSDGDDIIVYEDDTRSTIKTRLHHLRQQTNKPNNQANFCLADYVAPTDTTLNDYIGGFVVTTGLGADELAQKYEEQNDDYTAIMVKALADRLAEAFAEKLHHLVRTEHWGYATSESLSNEELIKERYQGIRPAPGYPACPDHTEKGTLFELLNATAEISVTLTEHYAMSPAAAVSGFYFSHPESRYFGLGKIDKDQVESYAKRKGQSLGITERWLSPNLKYA
tara:strand:- start:848 stop:2188 length:1341 start_codon:yes stop_codon:yes gene_type:complete